MSARYSEMPEEKWCPKPIEVRGQGKSNKQVGDGDLDEQATKLGHILINSANTSSTAYYNELLSQGVCREQARTVLPMGQYTEAYVTANLGDWLLFLKARLNSHAQKEIRLFAEAIYKIFQDLFPVTMEAFADYQLGGVKMSAQEMQLLRTILNQEVKVTSGSETVLLGDVPPKHWAPSIRKHILSEHLDTKRERQDFWRKINGT